MRDYYYFKIIKPLDNILLYARRIALDPDGNGSVDLSGGYHDCGDHVKFGIIQG